MLFQTFGFAVFFAVALGVFWKLPAQSFRLGWLLVASAVFYASWNPWFLGLIFLSTSIDYAVARRLPRVTVPGRRRLLLAASLGVNLGILVLFKYAGFLARSCAAALAILGLHVEAPAWSPVLPLGISFYTFEAIAYVVDVYRGRIEPARGPLEYAVYILFFPHLVAGPIVRPGELLPQLRRERRPDPVRMELGLRLFLLGLFKKAVLADHLAAVVDPVFASPGAWGSGASWLAVLAYSIQVYGDFSGYSDMAVGVAHAFGITLPENFRMPYFAPDIAEFWRRWHITLSRWLRDYVYIPLGGSREGEARTVRNALVTMLLCGLWHGAAWNPVAWGLYHGVLLSAYRVFRRLRPARPRTAAGTALSVGVTYVSVCFGLAIFRTTSLADAGVLLRRLVFPTSGASLGSPAEMLVVGIVAAVLLAHLAGTFLRVEPLLGRIPVPAMAFALAAGFLATQLLMPAAGRSFIYFQF